MPKRAKVTNHKATRLMNPSEPWAIKVAGLDLEHSRKSRFKLRHAAKVIRLCFPKIDPGAVNRAERMGALS